MARIDISGLKPTEVFAALFNYARPDMGEISQREEISSLTAFHVLKAVGYRFPYRHADDSMRYGFDGRMVPVDLRGATFNPVLYNFVNGAGAAEYVVECLRNGEKSPQRRLNRPFTVDM